MNTGSLMAADAQRKAANGFRRRSRKVRSVCSEVSAPDRGKALIRDMAKQFARTGPLAEGVCAKLRKIVESTEPRPIGASGVRSSNRLSSAPISICARRRPEGHAVTSRYLFGTDIISDAQKPEPNRAFRAGSGRHPCHVAGIEEKR